MRTAQLHLQRSTEALLGYLQGITCDDDLSDLEIANLQGWLESHHALREHGPFDVTACSFLDRSKTRRGGTLEAPLRRYCRNANTAELSAIDFEPSSAPKGHYSIAQGNALGEFQRIKPSPERAAQQRPCAGAVSPLSGLACILHGFPGRCPGLCCADPSGRKRATIRHLQTGGQSAMQPRRRTPHQLATLRPDSAAFDLNSSQ